MKYLLDVNLLISLGFQGHVFHDRASLWANSLSSAPSSELLTCSITELAFVRILAQPPHKFAFSEAVALLVELKASSRLKFMFVSDDHRVDRLPRWANSSKRITDGHLTQLAEDKGAAFATLGKRIPGAYLIP